MTTKTVVPALALIMAASSSYALAQSSSPMSDKMPTHSSEQMDQMNQEHQVSQG